MGSKGQLCPSLRGCASQSEESPSRSWCPSTYKLMGNFIYYILCVGMFAAMHVWVPCVYLVPTVVREKCHYLLVHSCELVTEPRSSTRAATESSPQLLRPFILNPSCYFSQV